ncbi:unnamed protein product [Paramecium octaurelia]|uniref:Uncharacterized protein n=1 Tax=Paramecium octaurelia TaxID=43137 RepID=A0A8S1VJC6_PAROT|nr:unnamed protein product [Paramecium octaurelia]
MKRCIRILSYNFEFMQIERDNILYTNQILHIETLLTNKILSSNILKCFAVKLSQQVQLINTAQQAQYFNSCLTKQFPIYLKELLNPRHLQSSIILLKK